MCDNIPVKFVMATSDNTLFDDILKTWTWSGQLYWSVQCLPNRQTSVAGRLVPRLSPNQWMPVTDNPTIWDFCKSNCSEDSRSMHIIFTFNPSSTDPNDYLQYVVNLNGTVTNHPLNDITDLAGNPLYLDITQVSSLSSFPYTEIWISKIPRETDTHLSPLQISSTASTSSTTNYIFWIAVGVGVLILILGTLLLVYRNRIPAEYSPSTTLIRNIM